MSSRSNHSHFEPFDETVIERARAGDEAAWELIVTRYNDMVQRIILAHVHNNDLAEELAADAFLAAVRDLPGFQRRDNCKFSTWLYTIALNTARAWCRKERVRRAGRARVEDEQRIRLAARAAPDPDLVMRVREAVEALEDYYRTVIRLRFFADLPRTTVAEMLGKTPDAISMAQFRALAELRNVLEEYVHDPDS